MITEQQIVSTIKRKHLGKVIAFALSLLIFPLLFALPFMNNGASKAPLEMVIILVFIGAVFSIIVDVYIIRKHLIPGIMDLKDVSRDPVFRAFRSPSVLVRVLNEIESSEKVYEQGKVKMTEEYLVDMKDCRSVVRLTDIIAINIGQDPHNTDGYALFAADKHNRTCQYSITGDKNTAIHLGGLIEKRCPNLEKRFEQPSEVVKL